MYSLATVPLIDKIQLLNSYQVWYADAAAGGNLSSRKQWWTNVVNMGPKFGYFPNASKSWLVKAEHLEEAKKIFAHN